MPSALPWNAVGAIAAFLTPVILLLLAALRLRRRLSYPHGLLSPLPDRRPAAFLPRRLRLYGDAALDAACAIVLGLSVAGWPEPRATRGPAIVVDASLSMLAGMRGDRPLDEAARLLMEEPIAPGVPRLQGRLFLVGRDPVTARGIIRDMSRARAEAGSPQALATALEGAMAFYDCDLGLVEALSAKGYGPVTFLTDDASLEGRGLAIARVPPKPARYLYPASASWDEASGRSLVRLAVGGGASLEALWRVAEDGSLRRARPEDYELRLTLSGVELSFREPGVWVAQWDGRLLPFTAPTRPPPLTNQGGFSATVASALGPLARPSDSPRAERGTGFALVEAGIAGSPGRLSLSRAETEPCVISPRLALGAIVACGFDPRADLSLGAAALTSPETTRAFWTAWAGPSAEPASPRGSGVTVTGVGEGYYLPARGGRVAEVLVPPPGEYVPSGRTKVLRAAPPPEGRPWKALALSILFAAKLALYALKLRRKGVRDSAPRNRT